MWIILLALAAGVLLGYINLLPEKILSLVNYLAWLGLVILLFLMGVLIGANQEILMRLHTLGLKAFLLALGGIVGSLAIVRFLDLNLFAGINREGGEK